MLTTLNLQETNFARLTSKIFNHFSENPPLPKVFAPMNIVQGDAQLAAITIIVCISLKSIFLRLRAEFVF